MHRPQCPATPGPCSILGANIDPAETCASYKIGQRVMLELRDDWRRRHGPGCDLKAFHARVLGCGNVGLDHLRRLLTY